MNPDNVLTLPACTIFDAENQLALVVVDLEWKTIQYSPGVIKALIGTETCRIPLRTEVELFEVLLH
jgi:hypothetical protein